MYADTIRSNMQHFLEAIEAENAYYQSVREKVKELPEQVGSCIAMPREDLYTLYTLLHQMLEAMD